ncbi:transporter substrate-binding domain-containing protein [Shewanella sp. AS1]|uniref:substrate-binding periplasmic protein n=1 Tax=Shewanella sp. AS1 TaxID=2907626 RepID=UPI001F2AB43F|nr:transporter substrate-binding domain-containing protein [Shewanella sp. AS1]MCE9680600.1 transporter substrate-binding domain-containing protein [Shewanella sp. AS1]
MERRIYSGLIGLFLLSTSHECFSQETLSFSGVQGSERAELAAVVLQQAYQQIDISVLFKPMNAKQGAESANAGDLDGVLARIDGIDVFYPNLIQVPIPINYLELGVFSTRQDLDIDGWYSLSPYKVGIIKGMLIAERNSELFEITRLDNYAELVASLLAGSIDVAVMPKQNGKDAISHYGKNQIKDLGVVLDNALLYHYLHRRHRELVPQISAILKAMLLDGTIQRLTIKQASDNKELGGERD